MFKSKVAFIFIFVMTSVLISCSTNSARTQTPQKLNVKVTFYWTIFPEDNESEELVDVKQPDGRILTRAPASLMKKIVIEGSGYLPPSKQHPKGQLINLACECDKLDKATFIPVDPKAPWGLDARGQGLVPLKTIAVDRKLIPLGTPVYIPKLVGIKTLNGAIHNGCVIAGDIGPAIKGNRIDIFSGTHSQYKSLDEKFNLKTINIYPNHPNCRT